MRNSLLFALGLLMALLIASCQIYVIEPPFKARFHNSLYTDIHLSVDGYGSRVIAPGQTVSFDIDRSDQSYHYQAVTCGKDASGDQIGLVIEWDRHCDISGDSYTVYLITYSELFFLRMRNTGHHDLHPLHVNLGLNDQTTDDIIIPGNGVTYNTGYYFAHGSTRVQANWLDRPTEYTYWQQGQHFYFPWTENQAVTLISDFKKGSDPVQKCEVESRLVEHPADEPFGIDAGIPRGTTAGEN